MAIVYQISLHGDAFDARNLSWESAIELSGCRPDLSWRDPIHKRPLLIGEFGCAVSHFRVWQKIVRSGVAGIVLEEDAVFSSFDVSEIDGLLRSHDSVWLGHRENTLGYWYNAHAYALNPRTAAMLCDGFESNIIPTDEWLPKKLESYSNYFYKPECVKQIPRSIRPSTIESGDFMNFVTIATDESKMSLLRQSAERHNIQLSNIGAGVEWRGGDMVAGQGGGQKINLFKDYISNLPDSYIILFVDGYDVLFLDNTETIFERFLGFNCDILFAAEKNCWPQPNISPRFPATPSPYKYLNSGLYIGKVGALKSFLNEHVADFEDDQLWMQKRFLELNESKDLNILLDYEGYIFQCDDQVEELGDQISNGMCCPCVYHGNGGEDAKQRYVDLAKELGYDENLRPQGVSSPAVASLDFEEVAKDILMVPFLSEVQCQNIIQKAESVGGWGQMEGDKFPAQEIRANKLDMWDSIEAAWEAHLGRVAEKKWTPMQYLGLRDAFVMRYSLDTQTSLGFHTDASLVTGSVKLNDDYEGGDLIFPHQDFSNKDVPIGHCILFPSQVTHGHRVDPLISGVKYSLTMWTSRFEGDKN